MESVIKLVYQFNKQAGLLENGYDDFLEASFQIEEALEGFITTELAHSVGKDIDASPKEIARAIVKLAPGTLSDVDRLDKACDAIVFALGSIFKLGLNPIQAVKALTIVMHHNFAKLSMPKDEFGKLTKPVDFIGPEEELQKLLNER